MNCTKSKVGMRLLRNWFLKPCSDITKINNRLHAVSVLIKPENANNIESIRTHVSKIQSINVNECLKRKYSKK